MRVQARPFDPPWLDDAGAGIDSDYAEVPLSRATPQMMAAAQRMGRIIRIRRHNSGLPKLRQDGINKLVVH